MIGTTLPPVKISPEEAISLFKFAGCEEMYRAEELYDKFKKSKGLRNEVLWELLDTWDVMSLLSFVYDTGRVQGIREERAKRAQ